MFDWVFPGSSDGKVSDYNAGDPGLIPGSGRSHGEGNGNLLQYSWLEKRHGPLCSIKEIRTKASS